MIKGVKEITGKEEVDIIIEENNLERPNIIINTDGKRVIIIFNKDKLVNTFSNMETIEVALHKQIKILLEKYLNVQANKEDKLRKGI
jgi:hypothetical protein